MSHFSSLLSSLGGTHQPGSTSSPSNALSRPRPAASSRPTTQAAQPASARTKRKHEDISGPSPARPNPQSALGATNEKPVSRPGHSGRPQPPTLARPAAQASQSAGKPITPVPAEARVPPKNSYQAILARAQAAQGKQPDFGQIKHKPVQKPARQIRSQTPEQGPKPKDPKASCRSPVSQSAKKARYGAAVAMASSLAIKPKRKPLELGYKGTMRPANSAATPESSSRSPANAIARPKPSSTTSSMRLPERSAQPLKPKEQRYKYKPESEDEEEEQGDYEEDASDSDDMAGGGFDELMAEEEASARAAKKEDAEELRFETELKRQKAEKKKALERLQAARRGKSDG